MEQEVIPLDLVVVVVVDLILEMDHFIFIVPVVALEVHKLILKNYLMPSLVEEGEDHVVQDVEVIYKCI